MMIMLVSRDCTWCVSSNICFVVQTHAMFRSSRFPTSSKCHQFGLSQTDFLKIGNVEPFIGPFVQIQWCRCLPPLFCRRTRDLTSEMRCNGSK